MMNQSDHILPEGPSTLPLLPGLQNRNLILASASPRRKQLLSLLGIPFEVRPIGIEEVYPDDLTGPDFSASSRPRLPLKVWGEKTS